MANPGFGSGDIPFSILNDDDFIRWVQPILIYILCYGRIPARTQLDPIVRRILHQVMERMIRGSFKTLLDLLRDQTSLTILAMIRAVDDRRAILEHIRETWPEVVTHGLVMYGWTEPDQVAETQAAMQEAHVRATSEEMAHGVRPLQTYYRPEVQAVVRGEASLAAALEEFEKLTLLEVQSALEDQQMRDADPSTEHHGQSDPCDDIS